MYLLNHLKAFLTACRQLLKTPFSSVMTLTVIGIAFTLPLALSALLLNVKVITKHWDDSAQISLYLKKNISETESQRFIRELRQRSDISKVNYISPEQALDEFEKQTKLSDVLAALNKNPLPAVVEVTPALFLQTPDEELKAHTLINVMEIVMKNIRQDAFSLFKDMLSCLEAAEEAGSQAYVQNALTYLLSTGEMQNSQLFIDTVRATLSPKTGEIIMTGAQQIAAEGEARGMKKGETLFLIRLLQLKFRHIPQIYQQKIAEADADTLLIWGARVLTATALEDIFVEAC